MGTGLKNADRRSVKEPTWMMRNRSARARFEANYCYVMDSGEELVFEQGGGAKDVGQTAWDGGIILSKYLEKVVNNGQLILQGKTILELGSGTGFVGLVCALLGANVVVTDLPGEVMDLLGRNMERNASVLAEGSVTAMPLDWSNAAHVEDFLKEYPKVDFILGAEVIYVESLVEPLLRTLKMLEVTGAEVLMSHGVHRLTPLVQFFANLRRNGLTVITVPEKDFHADFRASGLYIKRILRNTYPRKGDSQSGDGKEELNAVEYVSEKRLLAMEQVNETAVRNLEVYQRLEWDTFEGVCPLVDAEKDLERLVAIQAEKALLIERLGALEAHTAELICSVHEETARKEAARLRGQHILCQETMKVTRSTLEGHLLALQTNSTAF